MTELDAIFQGFLQGSFSVVVAAFLLIRMPQGTLSSGFRRNSPCGEGTTPSPGGD